MRSKPPCLEDGILITLNRPKWLIASANTMVVIHVIGWCW
jgi:hypothetical protein